MYQQINTINNIETDLPAHLIHTTMQTRKQKHFKNKHIQNKHIQNKHIQNKHFIE